MLLYTTNDEHLGLRAQKTETYQLRFLTLIFHDSLVYRTYWVGTPPITFMNITWGHYILYYSSLMLVNTVGAIIGYWINKITFIEKLVKKRKRQTYEEKKPLVDLTYYYDALYRLECDNYASLRQW